MDIYLRIKKIRESKGMTGKDFACSINIDNSQFSKIEKGKLLPTLPQVLELCSKYNVNTEWLLTGNGEMLKNNVKKEPSKINNTGLVGGSIVHLDEGSSYINGNNNQNTIKDLKSENKKLKQELKKQEILIKSLQDELIKSKDYIINLLINK